MPTYHYRCTVCKTEFDAFQSMMDAPLTECTSCKKPVIRIIQPVGIQFKGSGFYINDSKKSSATTNSSSTPSSSE
jgi:putative FmdB family regulatory protein